MTQFLNTLNDLLWGPPLIILMLFTGAYFTIRSGFFQVVHIKTIFSHTLGILFKGKDDTDESKKGLLTPFETIATAVGSTVGYGNIAGVATAVTTGGPGAVFWMWLTAFLGMMIKQVEVTLAVYFRRTDEEGNPYGGPTYYMERGLGQMHHWGKKWIIPAVIFGCGIFSTFFITASNYTTSEVIANSFHIPQEVAAFGILCAVYFLVWGGAKRLSRIFTKLVPIMSIGYLIAGLIVIGMHIDNLLPTLSAIFTNAFTGSAAMGGFAGAAVAQVISTGMARSVYSNEAGWGTSPMVHASAKTWHPVEQGLWGSFEVFVDTFIVCSITALTVLISGEWTSGATNATLALNVFTDSFGTIGMVYIVATMLVFQLTTSGGWYVYYQAVLRHLAKNNPKLKKTLLTIFRNFYAIPGFLITLFILHFSDLSIWTLVDITSAIPTFINVAVILLLSNTYFKLLKDYKARVFHQGEVDPNFALFYEDKPEVKAALQNGEDI